MLRSSLVRFRELDCYASPALMSLAGAGVAEGSLGVVKSSLSGRGSPRRVAATSTRSFDSAALRSG